MEFARDFGELRACQDRWRVFAYRVTIRGRPVNVPARDRVSQGPSVTASAPHT